MRKAEGMKTRTRSRARSRASRLAKRFALAALCLSAPVVGGADAGASGVEARYTTLDLDACETREIFEDGVGVELACAGLDGVPVLVTEGDMRFDVDFGVADGRGDTFAPFHVLGTTIEWRVAEGEPFAAILRFAIDDPEAAPSLAREGSVLGVYKVGRPGAPGCPLAYVDALENPDANLLAAQAADAFARAFRCGTDRATYLGRTGRLSGHATATQEF